MMTRPRQAKAPNTAEGDKDDNVERGRGAVEELLSLGCRLRGLAAGHGSWSAEAKNAAAKNHHQQQQQQEKPQHVAGRRTCGSAPKYEEESPGTTYLWNIS
ncbi:hypothetical protein DL762_000773 [Monosporascus cannonballus]|uniref:Uncharacterized protein n=1 Tax=Monosporascus cannonballus TaxID=155416 RepID=A0ABY0HIT4_9PEZI|nr:hypothetical protein DL762_000773 [Monosporascus cannonballus]